MTIFYEAHQRIGPQEWKTQGQQVVVIAFKTNLHLV